MKYVGIDYGAKRVGIAVSDEAGQIAFPREIISNDGKMLSRIAQIIEEEKIGSVIVGDTRSFSDFENPVTKDVEIFIEALRTKTHLPIERGWEAGSSIEASRYSPEGGSHNDSAAASIILQRYLDMHAEKNNPSGEAERVKDV